MVLIRLLVFRLVSPRLFSPNATWYRFPVEVFPSLFFPPSFAVFFVFLAAGHRWLVTAGWSPLVTAGHRRQCRAVHLPFSTDDEDEEDEGGAIAEERMLLLLLLPPPLLLLSLPPSRLPGGPPPPPPATEDPRKEEDEPEACIASSTSSEK